MQGQDKSGRLWMWGLTATIVVFIAFFVGFAIWTFQDDVELVYDNYYDKDVVFDQQIKRVARTQALPFKPILTYHQTTQVLDVKFPLALGHMPTDGEVLLFRPADLHRDRLFRLILEGDSLQLIELPDMDQGLWRIKLNWTSGGEEYYLEQSLMVN
ncbi:MAG: FixH family protein [FCB group bacterium]|nr:FixH family protein [FCB group bacterium]MBL7028747.1 FixH family protein [Candidatus Neomarinimicrobiota bacterium]MBL7120649.1 FixH family protein [Candidatus Neomarinimicrobiota bacterium]